jgi:hypothetical protein
MLLLGHVAMTIYSVTSMLSSSRQHSEDVTESVFHRNSTSLAEELTKEVMLQYGHVDRTKHPSAKITPCVWA